MAFGCSAKLRGAAARVGEQADGCAPIVAADPRKGPLELAAQGLLALAAGVQKLARVFDEQLDAVGDARGMGPSSSVTQQPSGKQPRRRFWYPKWYPDY